MTEPTPSPHTHYVNAGFDLGLRPRGTWETQPALVRQVRELSSQALLGAEPGDSAMLLDTVPDSYLDYLEQRGITVPRVCLHPHLDPESRLSPFGWSAEAMALNARQRVPAHHPPLEVVARVNARSFSLGVEQRLDPHAGGSAVVHDLGSLEAAVSAPATPEGWVLKAEHANSGLGNRRIRGPGLSPSDRRFAQRVLEEDDRLVVEPWLPRERDLCMVFGVPFSEAGFRAHEIANTREGALIGALFEPAGPGDPLLERLRPAARAVARELHAAGYFGPAGVDAFLWRDGPRSRLRPVVDINARRSMSDGAHRLWRRLAPEKVAYFRFFSTRKLTLPDTLEATVRALGQHDVPGPHSPGILLASPLRMGSGKGMPLSRIAVMFLGANRSEVSTLEAWFREHFEN